MIALGIGGSKWLKSLRMILNLVEVIRIGKLSYLSFHTVDILGSKPRMLYGLLVSDCPWNWRVQMAQIAGNDT